MFIKREMSVIGCMVSRLTLSVSPCCLFTLVPLTLTPLHPGYGETEKIKEGEWMKLGFFFLFLCFPS